MEFSVEDLERAVSKFYVSDSKAEAHQWLMDAQSSPSAWAFLWELLKPEKSREAQFFGANTLHFKIMNHWEEVPEDQYDLLKNRLLEVIAQYSAGPKLVLNRLCIALSTLVIQTIPRHWESPIEDLIQLFKPENLVNVPPEHITWVLLEVLSLIPEEFLTMKLGKVHKTQVRGELERSIPSVMSLLDCQLGLDDMSEVKIQAIKTLNSWIRLGIRYPMCNVFAQRIVNMILTKVSDPLECCENETDALYELLTHPDTHRYSSRVLEAISIILPLTQIIPQTGNPDIVGNIYKLFVGVGECHSKLLLVTLKTPLADVSKEIITTLFQCTAGPGRYPTEEIHSKHTFGFWYILQDELVTLEKDDSTAAKQFLVPVYEQLCQILLVKSQWPEDNVSLSSSDAELFRCYRQDIADTMVYVYYVVGNYMLNLLNSVLEQAKTWQEVEAVLHVAFALAETATSDNKRLVSLLERVPHHFLTTRVINSLNQAIGAYAESLSSESLSLLLPGLINSLQNTETSTSATMALKDITRESSDALKPHVQMLIEAAQSALASGHLKHTECVRLMFSIGKLYSILPYEAMLRNLEPLVISYITDIEEAFNQPLTPQVKAGVLLRIKMLATLCSTLSRDDAGMEPPTLLLVQRLIPVFLAITTSWNSDAAIIQEVCNCLKSAVVLLLEKCESILENILTIIVNSYSTQPNVAALEATRHLVILFAKSPHFNMITTLMMSISHTTLTLALNNQASEMSDVIQYYLNLLSSIIERFPDIFIASSDVDQLFKFGIHALVLPEMKTVKFASLFLASLITQSREYPPLLNVVQQNGAQLVHTVLCGIGGESPRSCLDFYAHILLALNKKYCDYLSRWLNAALSQENFPNPKASPAAKQQFASMVLRERANKRKLQEIVKEFAFACRGLTNSEYTSSTFQSIVR